MKDTYVKCADWSWEDKLLYIKACIGEDIPHNKICGHATLSKDDLLSLYRFAHYIYCLDSGMIVYDGQTKSPDIGGKTEVKLSDLKPKPTKFVKVEESIFDLKGEFERGELYCMNMGHYNKCETWRELAHFMIEGEIYRQVEIDWRDELAEFTGLGKDFYTWVDCIDDMYGFNFVEMCHLVASLTEKPEGV